MADHERETSSSTVINFGCRLNGYESEAIKSFIAKHNVENVAIFNTCTVTKTAEKEARRAIKKFKKDNADKKIIVTGCAAQVNAENFASMPEVSLVMGNEIKMEENFYANLNEKINDSLVPKVVTTDILNTDKISSSFLSHFEERTRAFVQIQNGCDHRCTFCIIPYGRGKSRSVPVREAVEEIRKLVGSGYKEIVLTGVDLTDYGKNLPGTPSLGSLCQIILAEVPELMRLRLSSIDVAEIDDQLIELIANEKRFMPHLHISLQSGDNLILKRMKRRHNREMVLKFCEDMRKIRPEIAFGSDIIAGFPTETEEMFNNTAALLKDAQIIHNHIFTYSPHEVTPSSRMPQVDFKVRKDRTNKLIAQSRQQMEEFLKNMVGSQQSVIIEANGFARCENFAPVKFDTASFPHFKQGEIEMVKIASADGKFLYI